MRQQQTNPHTRCVRTKKEEKDLRIGRKEGEEYGQKRRKDLEEEGV